MLHRLSERITLFLLELKLVEEGEMEIYTYGLEMMISSGLGILIALTIGMLLHETLRVCLFLMSFIFIRSYAGGYHAGSHLKCISLFGVVSFFSVYLGRLFEERIIVLSVAVMLTTFLLLLFAPLENENRRLDEEEKELFKRKSRITVLSISGIILMGLLFGSVGRALSAGLSTGVVISGVSLYVAIKLERRKKHETAENY